MANIISEYRGISEAIGKVNGLLDNNSSTSISDIIGRSNNVTSSGGFNIFNDIEVSQNGSSLFQRLSSNSSSSGANSSSSSEDTVEIDDEIKLVEPYNPTDPIVVFDPSLEKTELVRDFIGSEMNEAADDEGDVPDANNLNIDGVKIPIIQLNNTAIDFENVEEMTISLKGFLPELELKIYDYDGIIQSSDVPGMSNLVTVVLLSPVEGTNKKISLDFYITECKFNKDNTALYKGVMNLNSFRSKKNIQIGSGKLTTYEMLEQIAKDNDLGFAATENCKSINDKRYRQMYRETFVEFIEEQMSFAGTGTDTVIDSWIDEFGYLVMVNFSWVMSYSIDPFQLTIKTTKGINTGSKQPEELDNTIEETVRMISNQASVGVIDNMIFSVYTNEVDNSAVIENGATSKYYYLKDPCGSNQIQEATGAIIEPSMDGANDIATYANENIEFIGIDFTDDDDEENTPILVQKKNIQNYRASMCNKSIIVEMPKANYLLQRGTLVVVNIDEEGEVAKRELIDESDVVTKTEPDEKILQDDIESEEVINARNQMLYNDKKESMQNITTSGVYYIKDMTFKYTRGEPEIKQIMTLVKKGLKTNLKNYLTSRKNKILPTVEE